MKLDILANTMKEIMQKIIMRDELAVQKHHVPFFVEKERVTVPKHVVVYLGIIDQKMIVLCIHFMPWTKMKLKISLWRSNQLI